MIRRTASWIMVLSVGLGQPAYAQQRGYQEALAAITDTADKICQTAPLEQTSNGVRLTGDAKAKLSGVVGKVVDLGVEGAAEYKSENSFGVLQKDLVTAIQSSQNCKLEVFRALERKLLEPAPATQPPQLGQALVPTGRMYDPITGEEFVMTPQGPVPTGRRVGQ